MWACPGVRSALAGPVATLTLDTTSLPGFVDYDEVEAGYRVKLSAKAPFGSTRGPVSLVNYACTKRHRNTRYSTHGHGSFNLVATRNIAAGEAIVANYTTNVQMTCFGCHPRTQACRAYGLPSALLG